MTRKAFDLALVFGAFQPFSQADLARVQRATDTATQVRIVILAADIAPSSRTPFTFVERVAMIKAVLGDGIDVIGIDDHLYRNDLWLSDLRAAVAEAGKIAVFAPNDTRIARILGQIPDWKRIEAETPGENLPDILFRDGADALAPVLPPAVYEQVKAFTATPDFVALKTEYSYNADYKASWASTPYPSNFITVDTLLTCAGHILLVQRGGLPGRGQWALPGGFIEPGEWLIESALRELKEETGLDLDLTGDVALKATLVFDAPERSARGRIVSHGFYFEMALSQLPFIKGGDDAAHAVWMPLNRLNELRGQFLEDHASMISAFLTPGAPA